MKTKSKPPQPLKLRALGRKVTKFTKLETFPRPDSVSDVVCISDEVTAVCPVTGQPDQYTVKVEYSPRDLCVESKTIKLFLQSFRNEGHFCEAFASIIAARFVKDANPYRCSVTVTQKPRGGVSIIATAVMRGQHEDEEL